MKSKLNVNDCKNYNPVCRRACIICKEFNPTGVNCAEYVPRKTPKVPKPLKQKFFRGQMVRLCKIFPVEMAHFDGKGEIAVVEASYSDLYGLGNYSDFQLMVRCEIKGKERWHSSAWYHDSMMTLVSDDRKAGEEIIQRENERMDRYDEN
jgi:hypothetical protein